MYSSSSESDDDFVIGEFFYQEKKTRNEFYVEQVVPLYDDQSFIEHFRVSRGVVETLSQKFSESDFYPQNNHGRLKITAEKMILIFLWFAGHQTSSFRDVADRFNVSLSSLHRILKRTINFISSLSPEIIKWPDEEEKREIENSFSINGFPGTIGVMDGTHIKIDKPNTDPDSYINRHRYYSIQMQAVCDHHRKFTDVFIGFPGSVHDARVFRSSPLCQDLRQKCGEYIILADSAYPCLRNVLTPYWGNLRRFEIEYNKNLSKNRIIIEHAFGILKQKFRQLYHLKLKKMDDIVHFIRACCVLHNMGIEDEFNIENLNNFNDNLDLAQNNLGLENDIGDDMDNDNNGIQYRNYVARSMFR